MTLGKRIPTYVRHTLAVFAFTIAAHAQVPTDYEQFLIPIVPSRIPGAFGSEWVTELAVTNVSDTPVYVTRNPSVIPGLFAPLPPRATEVLVALDASEAVIGTLGIVERGRADDVAFTLRSRDTSRQFETWGTVVPVVRQADLYARRFSLVDIPADPQFRALLRIYDVNPATPPAVRVRIYRFDARRRTGTAPDELLAEFTPSFGVPAERTFPGSTSIPVQVNVAVLPTERLRVEIEPLDGAREYWAFVSVTHNATQHVTVITPR